MGYRDLSKKPGETQEEWLKRIAKTFDRETRISNRLVKFSNLESAYTDRQGRLRGGVIVYVYERPEDANRHPDADITVNHTYRHGWKVDYIKRDFKIDKRGRVKK